MDLNETAHSELPLFPLHTVLFPGGPLHLRIFEARYLEMISACLRQQRGFGVCLIFEGQEVGAAPTTHPIGTLAQVVDWKTHDDGLLGIVARGDVRFRVESVQVRENQLSVAQVELLPEEPFTPMPERFQHLGNLLERLLDRAGEYYGDQARRTGDASWVGFRLCELLPIRNEQRQQLLELQAPLDRLEILERYLAELAS